MNSRYLFVWILFLTLFMSFSLDVRASNNDTHKQQERSPSKTINIFFDRLLAGDMGKAKELLYQPIKDKKIAIQIDKILPLIAKQHQESDLIHVFESHSLGELSIVICGFEGSKFKDMLDIDPLFLRKQKGEWKIVFANSPEDVKDKELENDVLKNQAAELLAWYGKREAEVRVNWRKMKAKNDATKSRNNEKP